MASTSWLIPNGIKLFLPQLFADDELSFVQYILRYFGFKEVDLVRSPLPLIAAIGLLIYAFLKREPIRSRVQALSSFLEAVRDKLVRLSQICVIPAYIVGIVGAWYGLWSVYVSLDILRAFLVIGNSITVFRYRWFRDYLLGFMGWWILVPAIALSIPMSLISMDQAQKSEAKVEATKVGLGVRHSLRRPLNRILFLVHWEPLDVAAGDDAASSLCRLCSYLLHLAAYKYARTIEGNRENLGVLPHLILATYSAVCTASFFILERQALNFAGEQPPLIQEALMTDDSGDASATGSEKSRLRARSQPVCAGAH